MDSSCHQGILRSFFLELSKLPDASFEFLMRSFYPPKRIAARLLNIWHSDSSFVELRAFLERFFRNTYDFWLSREDPCSWLDKQGEEHYPKASWFEECQPLSHELLRKRLQVFETEVVPEPDHRRAVEVLTGMTDFHDIIQLYFHLPEKIDKKKEKFSQAGQISMLIRLKVLEVKGLEAIQEDVLREINFEIGRWIREEPRDQLEALLDHILRVLEISLQNYPQAALQIIRTMGLEIMATDQRHLINFFLRRIVRLGFQSPMLGQVSSQWQISVNPAHLSNVRVWLDIIKAEPLRSKALLSALIVDLSLGGIFVRDTDLFQKDVSQLLNSPIRPVYNLVKQLAKLFPVYFSQIGAEGLLRKVSTDIDEITGRSDRLIHFLRKQSHVESNNVIVAFIQGIIEYWRTMDKSHLAGLVPDEVYFDIPESGPLVDDIHRIFEHLFGTRTINRIQDLLDLSEDEAKALIGQVPEFPKRSAHALFS